MGRIRTIKPELFRHEELYRLEMETRLPIRIAWAGLFTICDREGRFEWKPNIIKLDVLPFDELDFSHVLNALASRGFIVKYRSKDRPGEKLYGSIPSFKLHQVINNKESASKLPDPNQDAEIIPVSFKIPARAERELEPTCSPLHLSQGEVEGEMEREQEGKKSIAAGSSSRAPRSEAVDPEGPSPTALTWRAYRDAYAWRHGAEPKPNAKIMGQLKQLVSRIPAEEAPQVAAFYVKHDDQFYVKAMHPVGLLLRDAEKLRTEWATGRTMTQTRAKTIEKASSYASMLNRVDQGAL
jgi:hypothetical protein